jgi:hypothetical protein
VPNGRGDDAPVTWGRFTATTAAVGARIDALERTVAAWLDQQTTEETAHKTRIWQAALAIVTGLVLPLVVIGIVALIHLLRKS